MSAPTTRDSRWVGAVLSVLILSSLACSLGGPTGAVATTAPSQGSSATPTPQAGQPAAPGSCTNPLYPVVQGAAYSYQTTSTLGGSTYTKTISAVRPDGFTVFEDFKIGKTETKEWKCTTGGLVSLAPVGGSSASVSSQSSKITLKTATETGVTLPSSISAGQTWTQTVTDQSKMSANGVDIPTETATTQTFTAVAMENVTVPAGTFDAMKITVHAVVQMTETLLGQSHSSSIPSDSTLWYAPGIGEIKAAGSALGLDGSTELVSYKIP